MKNKITAAAGQFDCKLFDKAHNLAVMEQYAKKAKEERGADLIVFPEGALAGYCFESAAEAAAVSEPLTGPSVARMLRVSQENGIVAVFGMSEAAPDGRLYNDAVCCFPNGRILAYRKAHLPLLGLDRFVTPGGELAVIDTDFGRVGMLVCYDMRFPEAARAEALDGARLLVHATNLPPAGKAYPDFLNRARACENRVFLVSANRTGEERGCRFIGRSQILDCGGEVLAELGEDEGIITAELDLARAEEKDIIIKSGLHEMHVFSDRRPALYGRIAQP